MLVKALCGVLYGGALYAAGQEFEADRQLSNTEVVKAVEKISPDKHNEPKEPEAENTDGGEPNEQTFGEVLAESKKKRR